MHRLFEYKGNKYWVIEEISTKHPVSREWVPYIVYRPLHTDSKERYSREKVEFYERFKQIDYEDTL